MEDENKSEVRKRDTEDNVSESRRGSADASNDNKELATPRERPSGDGASAADEESSDSRDALEVEQREIEQRWIDETEVVEQGRSTAAYRRAMADYDPRSKEPQLIEHAVFIDEEYERFGYL